MQGRLRYLLRLSVAFISRFKALIVLGFIFGIILFFIFRFIFPVLIGGSTERIGMTGRFTPNSLPQTILSMIGQGLTKLDKDGSVIPDLASSWETPDKGKTWIFHLKKGIVWQDGKAVTSASIAYAFSDVNIERPDATTIDFKLQSSYAAFPSVVSRPTFKSGLLGTGQWKVENLSLVGSYVDEITLSNKNKERLIYKFYPTEEQSKLAFELGEIDSVQGLFDAKPLDSWPKIKVNKVVDTGEYVAIFLNTNSLSDKSLRQALAYAIDKTKLGGERAISPISIDSWAYNPQVKPYDYDAAKAKGLIDDYKKANKLDTLNISLTTPPVLLSQAESIVTDWQNAGITVNLQVISNVPSDYQALLAIFDIPEDPDQYSIWHSTQTATNITHYSNPRIDKLLEDGRTEIDSQARKQIYFDFQRYLVEDSPAIFLYYPTTYTVNRK